MDTAMILEFSFDILMLIGIIQIGLYDPSAKRSVSTSFCFFDGRHRVVFLTPFILLSLQH